MRGLSGKRVLITGGAGGIGSATAQRFIDEGALVAVFDRNEAANQRMIQAIPEVKFCLAVDLADDRAVENAFIQLDSQFGPIDVLINNAGISLRHSFLEISPAEWRKTIDTNLNAVFYVAQRAARRMLAGNGGVIINMGSTNGLTGYHYYADYNASKAGVIELTRSMALELGPKIRVNCVCPGFILTPMQEAEYTPEMRRAFEVKVPLEKLGKPEDVAGLFAFLASDDAAFISGHHFVIDGGEIAGGLASQR